MPRLPTQIRRGAGSPERRAGHGMQDSPEKLRKWKLLITGARSFKKSVGKSKRLFLTSISWRTFEANFTTFAATPALKIAWPRIATQHRNVWPASFWRQDQQGWFTRVFGTKGERVSRVSVPPW